MDLGKNLVDCLVRFPLFLKINVGITYLFW